MLSRIASTKKISVHAIKCVRRLSTSPNPILRIIAGGDYFVGLLQLRSEEEGAIIYGKQLSEEISRVSRNGDDSKWLWNLLRPHKIHHGRGWREVVGFPRGTRLRACSRVRVFVSLDWPVQKLSLGLFRVFFEYFVPTPSVKSWENPGGLLEISVYLYFVLLFAVKLDEIVDVISQVYLSFKKVLVYFQGFSFLCVCFLGWTTLKDTLSCHGCVAWRRCNVLRYVVWQVRDIIRWNKIEQSCFPKTALMMKLIEKGSYFSHNVS